MITKLCPQLSARNTLSKRVSHFEQFQCRRWPRLFIHQRRDTLVNVWRRGVDEEDRPKIVRWMHYLEMTQQVASAPWATFKNDPMFIPRYVKNVSEMFKYGEKVMADRRANPRDDLLTVIANSTLGGETLPQEYLDGSWLLIIFAGNDTTRNSLSGTMRLLTEFPDQKISCSKSQPLFRKCSKNPCV